MPAPSLFAQESLVIDGAGVAAGFSMIFRAGSFAEGIASARRLQAGWASLPAPRAGEDLRKAREMNVLVRVPARDAARIFEFARGGLGVHATAALSRRSRQSALEAYADAIAGKPAAEVPPLWLEFAPQKIDDRVDALAAERMRSARLDSVRAAYRSILSRTGIAAARLAHQEMKVALNGARHGAARLRMLWATAGLLEARFRAYARELPRSQCLWAVSAAAAGRAPEEFARERGEAEWLREARRCVDKLANYQIDLEAIAAGCEEGADDA